MLDEVVKPYILIATFCEKILEEKDDVLSVMRLADRLTVPPIVLERPENIPTPLVSLQLLLKFMSLNYSAKRILNIKVTLPTGEESKTILSSPIVFFAERPGVQAKINLNVGLKHAGRYWFAVCLEDEVFTRVPLEIVPLGEESARQ